MIRLWPDSLPGPSAPYSLRPAEAVIRTDMEVGAARARRISRARRDLVDATFVFTKAEMELFRAWFDDAPWSLTGDSDELAGWALTAATLSADAEVGPDGELADRLIETATNNVHLAQQGLGTIAADTVMSLSATIKAAGRTNARLTLLRRDGSLGSLWADLSTGAITALTAGVTAGTITDRGGGWWRLTLEDSVLSGAGAPAMRIYIFESAAVGTYTGDGVSGIAVCEVQARIRTGFDLFGRTGADGRITGADGGAAWVLMPLSFGGYLRTVEARFQGPFAAEALPGLGWRVTVQLEVRDA